MSVNVTSDATPQTVAARDLFQAAVTTNRVRADRLFAGLLVFQWVLVIVLAVAISPRAWAGPESSVHLHVWVALLLGGLCAGPPAYLALTQPGHAVNGFVIAVAQMLMGFWSST